MAEEHNWEEASNHTPCANNCGFFGSTTTLNLCSKCYKHYYTNEKQISTAIIAVEKSLYKPETTSSSSSSSASSSCAAFVSLIDSVSTDMLVVESVPESAAKSQPKNRCGLCRRRVGLTGFTCRCGTTFCGTHRYPEKHGCSFDFKTMGKEAIAKANPVVKAAKLEKI